MPLRFDTVEKLIEQAVDHRYTTVAVIVFWSAGNLRPFVGKSETKWRLGRDRFTCKQLHDRTFLSCKVVGSLDNVIGLKVQNGGVVEMVVDVNRTSTIQRCRSRLPIESGHLLLVEFDCESHEQRTSRLLVKCGLYHARKERLGVANVNARY